MKTFCFVTSFTEKYYANIGKITLPTWKILDGDKIFLCEMDPSILDYPAEKIDIRSAIGSFHPQLQKSISKKQRKAYKFFKKAYCIWYALNTYHKKYDFIIWLDTDCYINKPLNLANILPAEDELFATIIRGINACDSGIVAFNTKFPKFDSFINDYIGYYINGTIWKLNNPWDAYILEDFSKKYKIKNLYNGKPDHNSCGFLNTAVEESITHFWGRKRKIDLGNMHG